MKTSNLLLAAWIVGFSHFASALEMDLACSTEDDGPFQTRQILVGNSKGFQELQVSSESDEVVRLKKYAVVIEIVGGENDTEEKWEVLRSKDFRHQLLNGVPEEAPSWQFVDRKNGRTYICNENHEVRANPALTRSN